MNWAPTSLLDAILAQVKIKDFLRRNNMRDLVGDFGEMIAHETIVGKLMPPVTKGHDIDHPKWGRVQVKTRQQGIRLGGVRTREDRAVLNRGLDFEYLFHLILDDEFRVKDAVMVPQGEVALVISGNSGKITLSQSKNCKLAMVLRQEAMAAEKRLHQRFT